MFIMKQKSSAPSRSSPLPALPLVLGLDSLAHDCVLRASFLLLEIRTGTGVAEASLSSTAGVVFFHEASASLSSSFGRLLLYAVGHFEQSITCAY